MRRWILSVALLMAPTSLLARNDSPPQYVDFQCESGIENSITINLEKKWIHGDVTRYQGAAYYFDNDTEYPVQCQATRQAPDNDSPDAWTVSCAGHLRNRGMVSIGCGYMADTTRCVMEDIRGLTRTAGFTFTCQERTIKDLSDFIHNDPFAKR